MRFVPPQDRDSESQALTALLAAQDDLLELVSKGAGLDQVLRQITRCIEGLLGSLRCTVHLVEQAEQAFFAQRPDTPKDQSAVLDLENGKRVRWSLPVQGRDGKLLGYFTLHYKQAARPSQFDLKVLDSMAALVRFAIRNDRLEQARRCNEERIASLTHSIPGVVYQMRVSPQGRIRFTYLSQDSQSLFGLTPNEVLADPRLLFDCYGQERREELKIRLLAASQDLSLWDDESPIVTRYGEEKWVHAIARPHREPDGAVIWNGIVLDSTRTQDAKSDLRKAMDTAEAASKAKMKFLALMSHELRTPLNAIIGFSGLLKTSEANKCEEYADDIHGSGQELLRIINDILEFTNLETGQVEFDTQEVSIEVLVNAVVRRFQDLAAERHIHLRTWVDEDLPLVRADHEKIKRILIVLLSNAVKFTPPEGEVRISAEIEPERGIKLSIADTGIGVAEEDFARAFEAFGQVDDELSRRYEGTGLGLALARCLAELHDADLSFNSEPGKGTTVELVFPESRMIPSATT